METAAAETAGAPEKASFYRDEHGYVCSFCNGGNDQNLSAWATNRGQAKGRSHPIEPQGKCHINSGTKDEEFSRDGLKLHGTSNLCLLASSKPLTDWTKWKRHVILTFSFIVLGRYYNNLG